MIGSDLKKLFLLRHGWSKNFDKRLRFIALIHTSLITYFIFKGLSAYTIEEFNLITNNIFHSYWFFGLHFLLGITAILGVYLSIVSASIFGSLVAKP